uniref:Uncharacterized protein n=1 Tax=Fagus sylvatica TaxID=28930 RepID=A0A2N9HRF5_FAGSY
MSTAPDMSKLEPFDGNYYKRWSERMLFYLESIHVDFVLFNDRVPDDVLEPARSASIRTYEKANRTCRGHILHYLSNSLFDIYCGYNSAKEIWDALKKKYSMEDAGFKKYVVGRFLDYKMVDEKPIMDQVHEYQHIVLEILAEGMKIDEAFQAAALIEKLPPSWKDYRNYLKHKKRELSMEDLVVHIRIEESNRLRDQIEHVNHDFISKANLVKQKNQGKVRKVLNKGKGPNKRFRKGQDHHHPKPQANLTESEVIAAVVSKVNLVNNMTEWVVDTGATRHICSSKELFLNYEEATDGENVYLGDARTARVAGKGKVLLKLTSGKSLALHSVLHVPDIRRNLVSGSLLNKAGIKLVFDADKLVLTQFFEHIYPMKRLNLVNERLIVPSKRHLGMDTTQESPTQELRRSKRSRTETGFGLDFIIAFLSEDDPKTYQEAMKSIDASFWKDAINSELESIMANHTWELVDLPRGCKPIGCKWVFKKKLKADGSIDKFKARLVAKGYTQKEGVDYFDTYSPVTKITTIRILIAIASSHNLLVHQMDVKTAFLNGDLDEEIYMNQPEGFIVLGQEQKDNQGRIGEAIYLRLLESSFWIEIVGTSYSAVKSLSMEEQFCVSRLSRYTHNPSHEHWTALTRLLRYLKGTMDLGLHFAGYPIVLEGYCDANWVSDNDETNSTSGYVFTLGGGAVSWKSSKQTCKARSTMESEFVALEMASTKAEWLRTLLADIPLWTKPATSISLHCDSQAAIGRAKNKLYNGKQRHMRLRHNIVRQLINNGVIALEFVRSEKNLADPLTKGLSRKLVHDTSRGMGLRPIM